VPPPGSPLQTQLPPPISLFAKVALAPLALVFPALCIAATVIRLYIRNREPRVQHAWLRYTCSLFIVSGVITTALLIAGLFWPRSPIAAVLSDSHALDTITEFPDLKQTKARTPEELAKMFRKTVFVITPQPPWGRFSREDLPATGFGSGVLVFADQNGYLILSSRHVIDGRDWQKSKPFSGKVAVVPEEGDFTSATIAGRHRTLDLILLQVPRHSGNSNFVQPIGNYPSISPGERILVFGHPEGLFFSVSDGIVSRKDGQNLVQITAPVSPGASGGPVYDLQGRLLGVVSWMIDKQRMPQSENLNFAVRADAALQVEDWTLAANSKALVKTFITAVQSADKSSTPPLSVPGRPPTTKLTPTKSH
jgi:S1-C subfamily serine protease